MKDLFQWIKDHHSAILATMTAFAYLHPASSGLVKVLQGVVDGL